MTKAFMHIYAKNQLSWKNERKANPRNTPFPMKDEGGLKLKVNHLTNRFFHLVLVSASRLSDPKIYVNHRRLCYRSYSVPLKDMKGF